MNEIGHFLSFSQETHTHTHTTSWKSTKQLLNVVIQQSYTFNCNTPVLWLVSSVHDDHLSAIIENHFHNSGYWKVLGPKVTKKNKYLIIDQTLRCMPAKNFTPIHSFIHPSIHPSMFVHSSIRLASYLVAHPLQTEQQQDRANTTTGTSRNSTKTNQNQ